MRFLVAPLLLLPALAEAADVSALVQGTVKAHRVLMEPEVGDSIKNSSIGPMAYTKLGAVRGVEEKEYIVFKGIPFVEKPKRFEEGEPKKPWAPKMLNATQWGLACIGARTYKESENCLTLNIWAPKGEHKKKLPVIVYFHGGINQHGSGQEALRWGDGVVMDKDYPVLFVNFDFRLGIFGWIDLEGSNISRNLGLRDQQAALRWVNQHISAFGGDPNQVTLQGQSEGCGIILVHMVSPQSMGLFHRAVFHSAVADMWARGTDARRTQAMIEMSGCKKKTLEKTVRCLKHKNAENLWSDDWVSEELSRHAGSPPWFKNMLGMVIYALRYKNLDKIAGELGWHAVVDNDTLPGEPRDLIRQGKWNKIPVLLTVSPNETYGCIPGGAEPGVNAGLQYLLKEGDIERVAEQYNASLEATGVHARDTHDLLNQMLTDKLWTCDLRSLAADLTMGGGSAYLSTFKHAPKYARIGVMTSPVCEQGATCHADEMMYVLPQGDRGIQGWKSPYMQGELDFAFKYMHSFLAFVHGNDQGHPWARYDLEHETMTFYHTNTTWTEPHYRKAQCDILDTSMGEHLPSFMRRVADPTLQ